MFRDRFVRQGYGYNKDFRWRGGEVSRIEGFTDAVFAFAVTLLVVSLEVPKTFTDLLTTMRGFFAFGLCFLMLIYIWHIHYIFFRRYGLKDTYTITLNALLLFVILFYIYPLKFLFTFVINMVMGIPMQADLLLPGQGVQMMLIYNAGYFAVMLIFSLMFIHAYRKREDLRLNELERLDTRISLNQVTLQGSFALVSTGIVMVGGEAETAMAGWIYGFIGPVLGVHGFIMGRRRDKLQKQVEATRAQQQRQQGGQRPQPRQQQRGGQQQHGRQGQQGGQQPGGTPQQEKPGQQGGPEPGGPEQKGGQQQGGQQQRFRNRRRPPRSRPETP
ncbi:MAG: TMEM175 family protein [Bacteroidota bacterium]